MGRNALSCHLEIDGQSVGIIKGLKFEQIEPLQADIDFLERCQVPLCDLLVMFNIPARLLEEVLP